MKRASSAMLLLLCTTACAEAETPRILDGPKGACGSVVKGATPADVECPSECPIAVKTFRVIDTATCERSTANYVACVRTGGQGQPGAALLDTEDGTFFVDDPAFDCNRDDGCTGISTTTTDRWQTCAATDDPGCACVCQGGECTYDRFLTQIDGCGLPTPCAPLTGEAAPTEEQLQCYMDTLAMGGPIKIEVDIPVEHSVTGEQTVARTVLAVASRSVVRLEQVDFDRPVSACELQGSSFFFDCDPGDPIDLNVENEEGMIERLPCTDPRAWILNCGSSEPICPN